MGCRSMKLPWLDRTGQISPLKSAVFTAIFIPGLLTLYWFEMDMLGGRPLIEVLHETGLWTIRLLVITLAITPTRQVFKQPKLVILRRMTGVAAFTYLVIHFCFYIVDQKYDLVTVASEIVHRVYLLIGFVTLLILTALAVTSTDGMTRRIGGKRWLMLHRLIYLACILGIIHYFLQSKLKVLEPTWFGGLVAWLLIYRVLQARLGTERAISLPVLLALSLFIGIGTALAEAAYYSTFTGVPGYRVLQANWMLAYQWHSGFRPGWIALFIGLAFSSGGTGWRAFDQWRHPNKTRKSPTRLTPASRTAS